ncbi:hypothetical protein [Panacibacter ginsenosidivorans]|nr:hypothetical protein [Panacibacter ginsenosidivorans]
MLSKNDAQMVYETLLTSPGMNEEVKINLRIPRKSVLLLSKLIEAGLTSKGGNDSDGLFAVVDSNTFEEIKAIAMDILGKAGLTDTYNKLVALQTKG